MDMQDEEERKKKQLQFVMHIGINMRNYVTDCLIKTFDTHEERSAAFYSLLINYVANSIMEVSDAERLPANIQEIIDGLQKWIAGNEVGFYKFDPKSGKLNREGLH